MLVVQGDERTGAGHRIEGHFRTTDDEPLVEIPMGTSPQEAYANLESAFNNELESTVPYDEEEFVPQERVKRKFKIKDKKGK